MSDVDLGALGSPPPPSDELVEQLDALLRSLGVPVVAVIGNYPTQGEALTIMASSDPATVVSMLATSIACIGGSDPMPTLADALARSPIVHNVPDGAP